jgi:hypothetical protein
LREEVNRVLNDVPLTVEIREDVDRRIGHEQGVGIGWNVHHEHMADATLGPQPNRLCRDAAHKLVGVQTTLHQHLALGSVDQLYALGGRCLAVWGIDYFEPGDVETVLVRGVPDLGFRADQDGLYDAGLGTVDRTAQRCLVAGMDDDGRYRRKSLTIATAMETAATNRPVICVMSPSVVLRRLGSRGRLPAYSFRAFASNSSIISICSQENSERPKWPYAAVFR